MSSRKSSRGPLLTVSLLALLSGCSVLFGPALVGSGVSITESRETEAFQGVRLGGAMNAQVTVGDQQSVEITGDDNIVAVVKTEVRNGVLKIWTDYQGSIRSKEKLTAVIMTPELDRIDVSGASNVMVDGIYADRFDAEVSGASHLKCTGTCEALIAEASGASHLKLAALEAQTANVDVSGASHANVTAMESISGEASGASSIKYGGDPSQVDVDTSGASSVQKR